MSMRDWIMIMPAYAVPDNTQIAQLFAHAFPITQLLTAQHMEWRIVGGATRDLVCGVVPTDIDIEVVAPAIDDVLTAIKATFPQAIFVANEKPVIRVRLHQQWFDVSVTAHRSISDAAADRDFTMNALCIDAEGRFHDPYAGLADMQAGVIRHIGTALHADPLRVLRLMRFAGRYGMRVASDTAQAARAVLLRAAELAPARVWGEWHAWAVQSISPSAGLAALADCGWRDHYPMLADLVQCHQDPYHHPEGDVWTHTCHVCDAVVRLGSPSTAEVRLVVMLAALCHDLGKPLTTTVKDGRIVSPGHAAAGMPLTAQFLTMIHAPERIHTHVIPLVGEHMVRLGATPSDRAVRRLAQRLHPATIEVWGYVVNADGAGRPPLPATHEAEAVLTMAEKLGIHDRKPAALVRGHDVLACGIPVGPLIGTWLRKAYDAQLDGAFATHTAGVAWLQQQLTDEPTADVVRSND